MDENGPGQFRYSIAFQNTVRAEGCVPKHQQPHAGLVRYYSPCDGARVCITLREVACNGRNSPWPTLYVAFSRREVTLSEEGVVSDSLDSFLVRAAVDGPFFDGEAAQAPVVGVEDWRVTVWMEGGGGLVVREFSP